jgi:hypothetical protein
MQFPPASSYLLLLRSTNLPHCPVPELLQSISCNIGLKYSPQEYLRIPFFYTRDGQATRLGRAAFLWS